MCNIVSQIDLTREFFINHPKGEYNAVHVSDALEIKESTVRQILARLSKQGEIIRSFRGFYRSAVGLRSADLKELTQGFNELTHGLKLVANRELVTKIEGSHTFVTNVTNCDNMIQFRTKLFNKQSQLEDYFNTITKGDQLKLTFKESVITVQLSSTLIEVDIKNSDKPFTIPELDNCLSFLEAVFYPHFNDYDWKVKRFGIGVDIPFSILRIDGAKSISLQHFRGWIKRWYEKNNLQVCRKELHGSINAPIDEFIKDLRGISPLGSGELIQETKQINFMLDKLSKQYGEVSQKLSKITEILPFLSKDPLCFTW